jgi:hypothetical protein
MRTPDEVAAMQRLHGLGWGTRRIAPEIGCNRETVQRFLRRVPGRRAGFRPGPPCWRVVKPGWASGCDVIGAMLT